MDVGWAGLQYGWSGAQFRANELMYPWRAGPPQSPQGGRYTDDAVRAQTDALFWPGYGGWLIGC